MREIKFRMYNGYRMIDFDLIDLTSDSGDGEKYGTIFDGNKDRIDLDMKKIMQYTGLKDKNGKEIYEGDFIQYFGEGEIDWNLTQGDVYGPVELEYSGFQPFADSLANCGHCGGGLKPIDFQVCGNIYENPELLK